MGWKIKPQENQKKNTEKLYEKDVFFTNWFKNIGVSEKTAKADACKIEHAISEETYRKIKLYIETNAVGYTANTQEEK